MKRLPHRDEFEPSGGHACKLERHADRAGSTGRKQNPIQVSPSQRREPGGQFNRRLTSVSPGAETQLIELVLDGGDDSRVSKPDLMHIVAVKIKVTAPLDIFDPCALGTFEHVQTRRGERLVEELASVLIKYLPGCRREALEPGCAMR
jgi:hypothetical protein